MTARGSAHQQGYEFQNAAITAALAPVAIAAAIPATLGTGAVVGGGLQNAGRFAVAEWGAVTQQGLRGYALGKAASLNGLAVSSAEILMGDALGSASLGGAAFTAGALVARRGDEVVGVFRSVTNKTPLTYDISNWAEYGLPSDGTFTRSLRLSEAQDFLAGNPFSFGGRPIEPYKTIDGFVDPGYPGGQGFIGRAEDTVSISTKEAYRELYKLEANQVPEFILDFQLKDPGKLQNVLYAPYEAFERGGKAGAGLPEFNYPGITSDDVLNPVLRRLK